MDRLDRSFHLLHEIDVPPGAFSFRSKTVTVPAVFQIWVRRPTPRRLGAHAGRLHHDFTVSKSSHYFIRGNVETVMAKLDFSTVARNTAGNPSLSKRRSSSSMLRNSGVVGAGDHSGSIDNLVVPVLDGI